MKFTLSWLKEHLDTEASVADIAEALTDLGLEVEGIENPAETLGPFRICRVISAEKHPDADRLKVCMVETWPEGPESGPEVVQVVCGAPNAREGLVGVFAPPGTHIPGTGVDLKPGVIRGVESNGMLCSERELMISDDHDGIIELPEDAPLGARFIDWAGLDDPVIEIAITPNRPDALGVRGIARDLAARGLGTLRPAEVKPVAGVFPSPVSVTIDPAIRGTGCPVFMGRVIRGVKNRPSPDWLRRRLEAIGLRPISALVDITNLLTYDRARPLHVFDVDKLAGARLAVREAREGETVLALDGREYVLEPGMMVIADENGADSIAGIMGGERTGVSEETTSVFVESALWDPIAIARTGRRLKIHSDARYRFERGVDPEFTDDGLELATSLILSICGGEASDVVVDGAIPDTTRRYRFDPARVQSLVGMEIPEAEQRRILEALGFRFEGEEGEWAVPPSWRPDIRGEADLVEEVVRVASLTKLEGRPLPKPAGVPKPVLTPMQKREQRARRQMAALGYNEAVTYSFIDLEAARLFGGGDDATRIENPISSEMTHMRPDLLPGLLRAASRNQARGLADMGLFEVGPVFFGGEPGEEKPMAAGILVGRAGPRDPHGSNRPVDIYDARGDVEAVLTAIGAPARVQILRDVPPWWHPGRAGRISLGPRKTIAVFGEIHPKVLAALDVKGPVVAFTVDLAAIPLPRRKTTTRPALVLHELQPVERDFAFVVDERVEAAAIANAARAADRKLISDVRIFDEFTGPKAEAQMGEGRKSVAITVVLQPVGKSLTDEEIEDVARKVIEKVEKATGASLRR